MKKILITLCLITLLPGLILAAGLDKETRPVIPGGNLTLDQACFTALENNPGVLQAKERINAAKAVLTQTESAWKPNVTASGHIMAIEATSQPDWMQTVRISEGFNEYSAGIQAGWMIFNGFTREANILASKYGIEQSKQSLQDAQRLLTKAVSIIYYQAQIAMEYMGISQQNQAFNQILEKDASIRYRVGSAPEADMLNFSVKVLQAESDFLAAQQNFNLTCTVLARLMAIEGTQLSKDMLPQRGMAQITQSKPDFDTELAFAKKNRPDLKALDKSILALEQRYRAAKGNYFPSIYLVSGLDYLYQDEKVAVDEEEHTAYLGVNFKWDLYTGGRRKGEIKGIYADMLTIKHKRRETLLAMQSEIREGILRAQTTWATWVRQKKTVELARSIRGHIEKAYKAGGSPLTRLNQAQTDFVKASGGEAASRIQYLISLVNLDAATGRINKKE